MDYASLLNDRQLEAVETGSQYVRVIAGAGSGKTRVLTYRIAYLISEFGVDPSRILAIAFTNKAAQEMKDRATRIVSELMGHTPYLQLSTFHSFCARFLRIEHELFSYPSSFTIMDEDGQTRLIKNVAAELGYKKGDEMVKKSLEYIRSEKGKGRYPSDLEKVKERFSNEKVYRQFYELYEKRKTESFNLDFDDLQLVTIRILESNLETRKKWSSRFDHILVDEFQDTNDVQMKLISLLLREDSCLYVVGDPDQTIYTWRGANQTIILNFEQRFKGAETIVLNENYRSTKGILDAANNLIANNKKRVHKDLFTKSSSGEKITAACLYNADDEAEWVAKRIATEARN